MRCLLALVSALFLLAGCAVTQAPTHVSSADFVRLGRFSLQSQEFNKNPQNSQGGFVWQDNASSLRLDLTSPLGNTLARIRVDPRESILVRSNGDQISAKDPDELIERVIGQAMPVSSLRDWLKGRTGAWPTDNVLRDEQGHVTGFTQAGWDVTLAKYDQLGPRAIAMRRDQSGQQVSIRLVVD